jgi:methylisocitrate lyase
MLQSRVPAAEKRRILRTKIASRELVSMPGAFNPLVARMIERHGFGGVYLSGHMLATSLGLPDIGLTTAVELAAAASSMARATDLPVIADADTGFGSTWNVARTLQLLEDSGIAGCHLEDQADPKRVGGSAGVRLVSETVAAERIAAAAKARRDADFLIIARTDAMPLEGLERALERVKTYREAGADAVFVEGIRTADEIRHVVAAGSPVVLNINELAGQAATTRALSAWGVSIAIYPMGLTRLALHSIDAGLSELREQGTMAALVPSMLRPEELADLVSADSYLTD